jgi:hypothetical protein
MSRQDVKRLLAVGSRIADEARGSHEYSEPDYGGAEERAEPPLNVAEIEDVVRRVRHTLTRIAEQLPMLAAPLVQSGRMERKGIQNMLDLIERMKRENGDVSTH